MTEILNTQAFYGFNARFASRGSYHYITRDDLVYHDLIMALEEAIHKGLHPQGKEVTFGDYGFDYEGALGITGASVQEKSEILEYKKALWKNVKPLLETEKNLPDWFQEMTYSFFLSEGGREFDAVRPSLQWVRTAPGATDLVTLIDTRINENLDEEEVHNFTARLGFWGRTLSLLAIFLQGGAFFALGAAWPVLAIPAMVLGIFFGGYLAIGAVNYGRLAQAVQQAMSQYLQYTHPAMDPKRRASLAKELPIAMSNGWENTQAMNILFGRTPWAAEQVQFHERFRNELTGMLALMPGVRGAKARMNALKTAPARIFRAAGSLAGALRQGVAAVQAVALHPAAYLRKQIADIRLTWDMRDHWYTGISWLGVLKVLAMSIGLLGVDLFETSCSKFSQPPAPIVMNPIYQTQSNFSIYQRADNGHYVIKYKGTEIEELDSIQLAAGTTGEQVVYTNGLAGDQLVQVVLTSQGLRLTSPYTDPGTGMAGVQVVLYDAAGQAILDTQLPGKHNYSFQMWDLKTGAVIYTGEFDGMTVNYYYWDQSGNKQALINPATSQPYPASQINAVYSVNGDVDYSFVNAVDGSTITIHEASSYPGQVVAVLLRSGSLNVFQTANGFIVEYFEYSTNAQGITTWTFTSKTVTNGSTGTILQSGQTVISLDADNEIQYTIPYTDAASGMTGTQTYTIMPTSGTIDPNSYSGKIVVDTYLNGKDFLSVQRTQPGSGQGYVVAFTEKNGVPYGQYQDASGNSLGLADTQITPTYATDGSITYTFTDAKNGDTVTFKAAARYPGVTAVLLRSGNLNVFQTANGFIVEYFKYSTSAQGTTWTFTSKTVTNGSTGTILQSGQTVISLDADNEIQYTIPYTDAASGITGTQTYTIMPTSGAIDVNSYSGKIVVDTYLNGKDFLSVQRTQPGSGQGYAVAFTEKNGVPYGQYQDASGNPLGLADTQITPTYATDGSITYTFTDAKNGDTVTFKAAARYPGVTAVLLRNGSLNVFQTANGIIVEYFEYTNTANTQWNFHFQQFTNGSGASVQWGQATVSLNANNEIQYSAPYRDAASGTAGTVIYVIRPSDPAKTRGEIEVNYYLNSQDNFSFQFDNKASGAMGYYGAVIPQDLGGGIWINNIQFYDPSNNAGNLVPLTQDPNSTDKNAYVFTDNPGLPGITGGNGTVNISLAHPFTAAAGYFARTASLVMAVLQAGGFFILGATCPVWVIPAIILGVFFGIYFVIGAVNYRRMARAVEQAMSHYLQSEWPAMDPKKLEALATSKPGCQFRWVETSAGHENFRRGRSLGCRTGHFP